MKFIFADSLDFVDPNYDFETDTNGPDRQPYWDDLFPHEILDTPPYDGILVSRATVGDFRSKGKYSESQAMRFKRIGARKFLRFDSKENQAKPVFGDCGSFSYARETEPPYKADDTVEFYADGQFTHGCSIDHIIFDFDLTEKKEIKPEAQERFNITIELATEFLKESKQLGKSFTPIGVAQGWSPGSLAESATKLLKMGYRYIAIGGLVPLNIADTHAAVAAVDSVVRKVNGAKIHLLGFAKADHLREFLDKKHSNYKGYKRLASFDTTSPLLRAFKDSRKNFYTLDENKDFEYFTAIRIPQAITNAKLKQHAKTGLYKQEDLLSMERDALKNLRLYDEGLANINETLDSILEYSRPILKTSTSSDESVERKVDSLRESYKKTLQARPWRDCDCTICKQASVDVAIFRASNRNKRRGIHNLNTFYNHLQEIA